MSEQEMTAAILCADIQHHAMRAVDNAVTLRCNVHKLHCEEANKDRFKEIKDHINKMQAAVEFYEAKKKPLNGASLREARAKWLTSIEQRRRV